MITQQYRRDRETARKACGVRLAAGHWASATVHAFRGWTGDRTLATWCGVEASTAEGARLTTDTITCLQCPQASLKAFRSRSGSRE